MLNKIKNLRLHVTFSALLSIVIGALLIVVNTEAIISVARAIAVILVLIGAMTIISSITTTRQGFLGIAVGGVVGVIGVWIFTNPDVTLKFIPIVMGVILAAHGLQDLFMAIEIKSAGGRGVLFAIIWGLVNIALGVFCIMNAFGIAKFTIVVIGIMLVVEGVMDCVVVRNTRQAVNGVVADAQVVSEEDI